LTRTIELLKTSEAIQLQVQDMTTTEQESTSTVQAIAKSRRKQNENTSRQQTGADQINHTNHADTVVGSMSLKGGMPST